MVLENEEPKIIIQNMNVFVTDEKLITVMKFVDKMKKMGVIKC